MALEEPLNDLKTELKNHVLYLLFENHLCEVGAMDAGGTKSHRFK